MSKFLLPLLVFAISSHAEAKFTCASLFQDNAVAFRQSEVYRESLVAIIDQVYRGAIFDRNDARGEYQNAYLRLRKVTDESIQKVLEASPALRNRPATFERPPVMGLMVGKSFEDGSLNAPGFFKVANSNPYLLWLKVNALREPSYGKKQDPVRFLSELRADGWLFADAMAAVRYRFDPTLSPEAVTLAKQVLDSVVLVRELEKVSKPAYVRNYKPEYDAAWFEMTSLAAGRKALKDLLNEQVNAFGRLFPRASFERALILSRHYHPATFVLTRIRNDLEMKKTEAEVFAKYDVELLILQEILGVSADLSVKTMYRLVDRSLSDPNEATYEFVLADVMSSEATGLKIQALRNLVEVGEAFQTEAGGYAYIESKIQRRH